MGLVTQTDPYATSTPAPGAGSEILASTAPLAAFKRVIVFSASSAVRTQTAPSPTPIVPWLESMGAENSATTALVLGSILKIPLLPASAIQIAPSPTATVRCLVVPPSSPIS